MAIPTVSSAQMKQIDSSSPAFGVSVEELMENAGKCVCERARKMLRKIEGKTIVILVGSGNKGGDGLVAARLLAEKNFTTIHVVLSSPPEQLKELSAKQFEKLRGKSNVRIYCMEGEKKSFESPRVLFICSLIIDAILGVGLESNPRGAKAELITLANLNRAHGVPILSVDVPSGLDSDSGKPFSPCVQATATLTLGLVKTGLLSPEAKKSVGKLFLADIGIPAKALEKNGLKSVNFGKNKIINLS